jgi:DNA-binding IclR family transcriptional regulator
MIARQSVKWLKISSGRDVEPLCRGDEDAELTAAEAPPEQEQRSRSSNVQSVDRALRVVTVLAENAYPMGVIELASRLQVSSTSVHRMLQTLMAFGWVEQNSKTSRYRLGVKMLGVGAAGLIIHPAIQNGKLFLRRLSDLTGFDSFLSTLMGSRVVYLAKGSGRLGLGSEFEPGISMPAHALADGKLLLAYRPREEREQLYKAGLRCYTPTTITDPVEMERELAQIRAQGYSLGRGERFSAVRGIAVPVLGPDGKPVLGMQCICRMELTQPFVESLSQQMTSLARDMSDQLSLLGDMPTFAVDAARNNVE